MLNHICVTYTLALINTHNTLRSMSVLEVYGVCIPLPWQVVHAPFPPQAQTEEKKQHELKKNQFNADPDRHRQAEPYIETVWPPKV